MTLCDDCRLAESDPLHFVAWRDRPCCIARRLANGIKRTRNARCVAVKDSRPEQWAAIRARLVALLETADSRMPAGTTRTGPQAIGGKKTSLARSATLAAA
jgi:hypothetical protein